MYTSTDLLGEGSFGKVYRGFSVYIIYNYL
jgi:hypothetical protein